MQILDSGDLLIAAVRESDAGRYTCVRANEAGQVQASAYLTVLGENILQSYFLINYGSISISIILPTSLSNNVKSHQLTSEASHYVSRK